MALKTGWHLFRRGRNGNSPLEWKHSNGCLCTLSTKERKAGESTTFRTDRQSEYAWSRRP